jgi:hypothetical protein
VMGVGSDEGEEEKKKAVAEMMMSAKRARRKAKGGEMFAAESCRFLARKGRRPGAGLEERSGCRRSGLVSMTFAEQCGNLRYQTTT